MTQEVETTASDRPTAQVRAAFLAVGSELLGTERLDTNSLHFTRRLIESGCVLGQKSVIDDDVLEIAAALANLAERAELIVVSGGLGPTADDLTREAVARWTGRALEHHGGAMAAIEDRYRRMERRMPEVNRRQAEVIAGATVIPNPNGTAPAQSLQHDGTTVFLLPGVPHEFEALVDTAVAEWLERHGDPARAAWEVEMRVACLPESLVEERIGELWQQFGRHRLTVLASPPGDIRLRIRVRPGEEQETEELRQALAEAVGDAMFDAAEPLTSGRRPERPSYDLEHAVGHALCAADLTLVTAESCTGGQLGGRLTAVPGSSAFFLGGVVSYTNDLKRDLLGVPQELLTEHGAVSEPVARAMAEGALRSLGGALAVSITGIAGPGGGTAEKPVGRVHLAVASADGRATTHYAARFPGDREMIRRLTTQWALELVRRRVLGLEDMPQVGTAREAGEAAR